MFHNRILILSQVCNLVFDVCKLADSTSIVDILKRADLLTVQIRQSLEKPVSMV